MSRTEYSVSRRVVDFFRIDCGKEAACHVILNGAIVPASLALAYLLISVALILAADLAQIVECALDVIKRWLAFAFR